MYMSVKNTPLSANEPMLLLLIAEELKSRKFFNTLQQLGLDDSYYQPHLDEAIMQSLGLGNDNATLDFYFSVMETHAQQLDKERESVEREARVVYTTLVEKKKKDG